MGNAVAAIDRLAVLWLSLEASLFPVSVHCLIPSGTEWLVVCGLQCSERSARWVRAKLLGLSQFDMCERTASFMAVHLLQISYELQETFSFVAAHSSVC